MKKIIKVIVLFSVITLLNESCKNEKTANAESKSATSITPVNDFIIVGNKRVGLINTNSTYDSLVLYFGASNLTDDTVDIAEGTLTKRITTVFPEDSVKELVVFWQDDAFHKKVEWIQIRSPKSAYKTQDGVHSGVTLNKLAEVNNAPINFSGFGWDYGGSIVSFNGGKLDSMNVHYYLGLALESEKSSEKTIFLQGDITLSTTTPKVKTWCDSIKVQTIEVDINKVAK